MKLSKIKKVISGTVSALMIAASIPSVASAADQQTRGNIGGFDYGNATEASQSWHLTHADSYLDQIKSGDLTYKQYAKLKLSLGFTPNIGTYANSVYRNNLYVSFAFGPKQHRPEKLFNFGFEGKF